MSDNREHQTAYDIYQTILSLHRKFGPQNGNQPTSIGQIQQFLSGGATKQEIMAWVLRGEARGAVKRIMGAK